MQSGLMLVSIAENESTYDEAISVLDQMMKFSPKGLQSKHFIVKPKLRF